MEIPASACVCRTTQPAEIREAFARHGFCVLRGFLPPEQAAEALETMDAFIQDLPLKIERGELPAEACMYDDSSRPLTLKQIQHLDQHSAYFQQLMEEELRPVCEAALGETVVSKNMYILM